MSLRGKKLEKSWGGGRETLRHPPVFALENKSGRACSYGVDNNKNKVSVFSVSGGAVKFDALERVPPFLVSVADPDPDNFSNRIRIFRNLVNLILTLFRCSVKL